MSERETDRLIAGVMERRSLLKTAALTAGAAGTETFVPGRALAAPSANDIALLNFVLNFEYLGAEYYLAALGTSLAQYGGKKANLTGGGIMGGPTGGPISVPPNSAVPFKTLSYGYFAQHLAADEIGHVIFLEDLISSYKTTPIIEPPIYLDINTWTGFALGAGLIAQGQTFNPFQDEISFLVGAYVLEDMCVSALAGVVADLTPDPASGTSNVAFMTSALGIEAYQSGMIRSQLSAIGGGTVTDLISAYRSMLSNSVVMGGGVTDDIGTDANGNPFNFTNADVNGQAFRRTPQQTLAVAYGTTGQGHTSGGFFPNGVFGTITST